jgi:hypothetical protein
MVLPTIRAARRLTPLVARGPLKLFCQPAQYTSPQAAVVAVRVLLATAALVALAGITALVAVAAAPVIARAVLSAALAALALRALLSWWSGKHDPLQRNYDR